MRIGFVGLGQMGAPIASHLIAKSGAEVMVVARRAETAAVFRGQGAVAEASSAALADSDIVFLCLPGAVEVHSVLLDRNQLGGRLRPGTTVIDLSTTAPSFATETGKELEARGISFVDAPISGMQARAVAGTLTVMCGCTSSEFERVAPILGCFGRDVVHLGPPGSGQTAKLLNQLLFNINAAGLAEVLGLSAALGLDTPRFAEVLADGTGRSFASETFLPNVLEREFRRGYPLEAGYKDIANGLVLAADRRLPIPMIYAAALTYQTALRRGSPADDKGGMVKVYEDLFGIEVGSASANGAADRRT